VQRNHAELRLDCILVSYVDVGILAPAARLLELAVHSSVKEGRNGLDFKLLQQPAHCCNPSIGIHYLQCYTNKVVSKELQINVAQSCKRVDSFCLPLLLVLINVLQDWVLLLESSSSTILLH
jgi:hypothetical protein